MSEAFRRVKVFVFDFDGTLVNSYSPVREVWRRIGEFIGFRGEAFDRFVKTGLEVERKYEIMGMYDRRLWIRDVLRRFNIRTREVMIEDLVKKYWSERIRLTIVRNCVRDLLDYLRRHGFGLVSLSGNDGVFGLKKRRIWSSGLGSYFDNIYVSGEDVPDKIEGLKRISVSYRANFDEVCFVDDMPRVVNEAFRLGFVSVRVEPGEYWLDIWQGSVIKGVYVFRDICEFYEFLRSVYGD